MITVVLQYAHVCVFFPDWSRASARPRGTIQCGGNKAHERSHCGEMYKLLLHQRCLLGLPAKVSQKSAVCYFSFCVLSQWTAVLCYSQTATLRPSQPPPLFFSFFLLFFFCLPLCLCLCTPALRWTNYMWSWISTEPFCRPCSAKSLPFEVLAVQTHHPHDHIISPKPDLCNTKWVPSQTFLYVRPQSHNRWYCVFELVVIMEVSSEKKIPRWRLRLFLTLTLLHSIIMAMRAGFLHFPPEQQINKTIYFFQIL